MWALLFVLHIIWGILFVLFRSCAFVSISAYPALRVTGGCSLFCLSFSNGGVDPELHPGPVAGASCDRHQEFMSQWKWNHMDWYDRFSDYAHVPLAVPVAPPLSSEVNTFQVKTWWKEGRALSLLVFFCNLACNHLRYTQEQTKCSYWEEFILLPTLIFETNNPWTALCLWASPLD